MDTATTLAHSEGFFFHITVSSGPGLPDEKKSLGISLRLFKRTTKKISAIGSAEPLPAGGGFLAEPPHLIHNRCRSMHVSATTTGCGVRKF